MSAVAATDLPASLRQLLEQRGFSSPDHRRVFLEPSLKDLASLDRFPQMGVAVARLREALFREEPIAIYADRDVDGLTGLAILARSLRTLGGIVHWGSPLQGRGLERPVIESLLAQGCRVMIFVDCGTSEIETLRWLKERAIDVIVADHHRLGVESAPALAWIHPQMHAASAQPAVADAYAPAAPCLVVGGSGTAVADAYAPAAPCLVVGGSGTAVADAYAPAGCVMAFKLAQGLWTSFLGDDPARMDYFLFSNLDTLCLGILADQVPLVGENRILAWHGLRRLAETRKTGLAALLRFFRLTPRSGPITAREANWQIIPLLNAAGRLGEPQWAVTLLLTEDPFVARECIDRLIALNARRRAAQDESLQCFERRVLSECAVDSDSVLVALANDDLEPSVTGLAAQSLARKYGRPTFLFVDQGDHSVGSGRTNSGVDLFAWVESHRDLVVKFGGHQGAVGLTIRTTDFQIFRQRLLSTGTERPAAAAACVEGEIQVPLSDIDAPWGRAFQRLEPFGSGFPMPTLELIDVKAICKAGPRSAKNLILKAGATQLPAESEFDSPIGDGPWSVIGYPKFVKNDFSFQWIIQEVRSRHG